MPNEIIVREYNKSDITGVIEVYRKSVKEIGPEQYNLEQVKVWSSYPDNADDFQNILIGGITYVAQCNSQLVSFGTLNPIDHIAFIYTIKNYSKKGIANSIYYRLETQAIQHGVTEIHTEASTIARYFFLKVGFSVVEKEIVKRKKTEFERYKMIKRLS